ncbi:MAG: PHP domain-containing protein, partial [Candidatus Omnitrophica bacterium]|nr:PHP domain-containing protein [Candidatus Omnitrophota bacterium]
MKFADLHLHTNYSDGTSEPVELVREAKKAGLDCIALADHDTIEGINPALEAAAQEGIELIPGIELSCEYNDAEVHILGYLIDYKDKQFIEKLAAIRKIRESRLHEMIEKLKGLKVDIQIEDVLKLCRTNNVGRLHLARAIVKKGYAQSISEAFQRFIGDNSPAYVCGFKLKPEEAIKIILSARGIPVLAHPYILGNDGLITQFIGYGLRGIEVYYPEHTKNKTLLYEKLAKERGLLI